MIFITMEKMKNISSLCINKLKSETKQEEDLCLEFKAIKRLGQQEATLSY